MQVYTLGHKKRTFSCLPTSISVAEHFITALLTAANSVSASPIPVHSCLLPTPAAWGSRQRTHCDETFSSKKEKKKKNKLFLAAPVLSPDPSTTTHICASRAEGRVKTSGQGSSCGCQEYFQKVTCQASQARLCQRSEVLLQSGRARQGTASCWVFWTTLDWDGSASGNAWLISD